MLAALAGSTASERIFEQAHAILGYDARAFDDERAQRSTVHVQIGLFLCGAICAATLIDADVRPAIVAGHSVGAFGGAVAANAIQFDAALRTIVVRARAMERLFPSGYGMAVCAGISTADVRSIVAQHRTNGESVFVANVNAETQTVIAGSDAALDAVIRVCAQRGARRAERLPVAVPSHCELLEPVAAELRGVLSEDECSTPSCVDLSGMSGRAMRTGAEVRADLCGGVAREVRWIDVARLIDELGATLTIECIPGRVLTDLFEPGARARHEFMDGMSLHSIVALARRER
jgi:malonate decarboxylase epsilon subunit